MNKLFIYAMLLFPVLFLVTCDSGNNNSDDDENGGGDVQNPVPSLTSLSPSQRVSHLPPFTLLVNGSNFVAGAKIIFDGNEKTTTFISSNQLSCQIDTADVSSAGIESEQINLPFLPQARDINVIVRNPAPGGGDSGAAVFALKDNYSFTKPVSLVPSSPNNDKGDIVVDSNGNIHIVFIDYLKEGSDVSPNKLRYLKSSDGSVTWSTPIDLSIKDYLFSADLAIDENDNLHVAWNEYTKDEDYICYKKMDASTGIWSSKSILSTVNINTYNHYGYSIDVKGQDLYIIDNILNYKNGFTQNYLFASDNSGSAFIKTNLTFMGAYGGVAPFLKVLKSGTILYAYAQQNTLDSLSELYLARSANKGVSWTKPVRLSSTTDSGHSSLPKIVQLPTNNKVMLIWEHNYYTLFDSMNSYSFSDDPVKTKQNNVLRYRVRNSNQQNLSSREGMARIEKVDLFMRRSSDGGANWDTQSTIYNYDGWEYNTIFYYGIEVDTLGNINIALYDEDEEHSSWVYLYFIRSIDDGNTWVDREQIPTDSVWDFPRIRNIAIDSNSNVFVLFWMKDNELSFSRNEP